MGFIFFGILLVIAGAILVIKTAWVFNLFGSLPFAEKYIGTGGSVLAYKLIGLILVFVGFLMIFNLFGPFMVWIIPDAILGR